MWNAFTATLEELSRQYEKIRAVQEKKRKILVALDMEALEKLTAEEDFLARAVERLETDRLAHLANIAKGTPRRIWRSWRSSLRAMPYIAVCLRQVAG